MELDEARGAAAEAVNDEDVCSGGTGAAVNGERWCLCGGWSGSNGVGLLRLQTRREDDGWAELQWWLVGVEVGEAAG